LDKLFIPINQGGQHWVFVVVFVQQKRIGFWDSFGEKGEKFLEGTLRYLCDEWRSMYNTSMDLSEWRIFSTETPRQHNSKFCLSLIFLELIRTNVLLHLFLAVDCGVFSICGIESIWRRFPLIYKQNHMLSYRNYLVLTIIQYSANRSILPTRLNNQGLFIESFF
jgi:Ulp1 family protease